MSRKVSAVTVWNTTTVPGSTAITSSAIDIQSADALALYLSAISGTTPSITFTYSLSPRLDGTFTIPQSPVTIGATKAAVDVMDFAPEAAGAIKIIATNNGTGAVVMTSTLVIQEGA
jgi:hypothetical protein